MKKLWSLIPVIVGAAFLLLFVSRSAYAAGGIAINSTNFPDSTFRQYIQNNFDKDKDGQLSSDEVSQAREVDVKESGITSLKGIEYLTSLERLTCNSNKLTALDVSKNTGLKVLRCYGNDIKTLDVSKNTALVTLSCFNCGLTVLDVSRNLDLEELSFGTDSITSIDLSNNTNLKDLSCTYGKLTSLNVSANKNLYRLACFYNQLTSLNLKNNTKLVNLNISNNQISGIDLSKCPELQYLVVSNNKLTSLDLSHNEKLNALYTSYNQISKLDISMCSELVNAYQNGEKKDSYAYWDYVYKTDDLSVFQILSCDKTTNIIAADVNPFTDVKKPDSYYEAVMWAVNNGITSGTSATTFSPDSPCTRYQFAVMLYKLNGKPAVGNVTLPFKDVKKTDSYYNAVAWAYSNGIISGTSKTTFSPKDQVTRYQVVQMLYKSIGKPAVSTTANPFKDVSKKDSYYNAVLWAVEKGITKGTDKTHFSPKATCKRYQMVVFLKKFNDQYHIK